MLSTLLIQEKPVFSHSMKYYYIVAVHYHVVFIFSYKKPSENLDQLFQSRPDKVALADLENF